MWADKKMSKVQKTRLLNLTRDVISVGLPDFKNGKISNSQLIHFGIYQNALRPNGHFQDKAEGKTRIKAVYVEKSAKSYFGVNIFNKSIENWNYSNGFYNGYSESFEQIVPEKITALTIYGFKNNYMTVFLKYKKSMLDVGEKDLFARLKIVYVKSKKVGNELGYSVFSYTSLSK